MPHWRNIIREWAKPPRLPQLPLRDQARYRNALWVEVKAWLIALEMMMELQGDEINENILKKEAMALI